MERFVPDPVVQPGRYIGENGSELILQPVIALKNLDGRRTEYSKYTFKLPNNFGGGLVPANEVEHRRIQQIISDSQMEGPFPIKPPEPGE